MTVQPEVLAAHYDDRGVVFEPLPAGSLPAQRNTHVVLSAPGQIRGNHVHRVGTEVLVVQGPALVRLREADEVSDFRVPDKAVHRFVIPPGVAHAIRHDGTAQGVLIGFNTREHDPRFPDTYREVILETA